MRAYIFYVLCFIIATVLVGPVRGGEWLSKTKDNDLDWQCKILCKSCKGKPEYIPDIFTCYCTVDELKDLDTKSLKQNAKTIGMHLKFKESDKERTKREIASAADQIVGAAQSVSGKSDPMTKAAADEKVAAPQSTRYATRRLKPAGATPLATKLSALRIKAASDSRAAARRAKAAQAKLNTKLAARRYKNAEASKKLKPIPKPIVKTLTKPIPRKYIPA